MPVVAPPPKGGGPVQKVTRSKSKALGEVALILVSDAELDFANPGTSKFAAVTCGIPPARLASNPATFERGWAQLYSEERAWGAGSRVKRGRGLPPGRFRREDVVSIMGVLCGAAFVPPAVHRKRPCPNPNPLPQIPEP